MPVRHIEHIDAANFYCRSYNHFDNFNLRIATDTSTVMVDDTILYCLPEAGKFLLRNFDFVYLDSLNECKLITLTYDKRCLID